MPERSDVEFQSSGDVCAAWHFRGEGERFAGEGGRPCVVMAHGIGGTRDSGLEPYAEAFADSGLDVLLFDYRGFGASEGDPRQYAWPPRHRDDYRAAVEFARGLDGVDPERIALWGSSWSGGHVVYVAADDPRIAAVVAQTPDLDGLRTLAKLFKTAGPGVMLRSVGHGLRDVATMVRREPPHTVPLAAAPGEVAALSTEESLLGYEAIAGPSWRNEMTARALLYEGQNRAITRMEDLRCPILIQVAARDSVMDPASAYAAAWKAKGRAEVREYPCAHFDIYFGEWRERSIADQLHFLRRHLSGEDRVSNLGSWQRNGTSRTSAKTLSSGT